MARNGKIARLPREVRHELNRQLQDGALGMRLVEWLNGLDAVKQVVAKEFQGREITESNLSDWKLGGYREWCAQQEILAGARELAADGTELSEAGGGTMAKHLTTMLAAKYALLVRGWTGEMDPEFKEQAGTLRTMCLDVAELRRAETAAERLEFDQQRWHEDAKTDLKRSLDALANHIKAHRELRTTFEVFVKACEQKGLE